MFRSISSHHPGWAGIFSLLWYLLVFMALVTLLIYLLRGPLKKHKEYDLRIFQLLNPIRTPLNNKLMMAITYMGKHQFLIPANLVLIAVFYFLSKQQWYAFDVLVLSLSSLLMMLLLKRMFDRARPDSPLLFAAKGKSFPSGHAMMSVCFYGLLLHMLLLSTSNPLLQVLFGVVFIGLILLIGFSRVYLQVHYVTDVVAGFIIGTAWLFVALQVFNKMEGVNLN